MPKAYITKQQQMNDKLTALIYGTMKVKHISQRQMADRLGISQQAFSKKLETARFMYSDLITIFEVLETPDEDILSVLRSGH